MSDQRSNIMDVFRGVAVLAVVLFHYTDRVPFSALRYENPIFPGWWSWGWVGPYWFFIISGFFMAASIEKSKDLISFMGKRVSRIYPAYFVAILIIVATMAILPPVSFPQWHYSSATPPLTDVVANFFFATDIGFDYVDGAFWTLVVELKFYLFLSLFFFLVFKRKLEKTVTAFGFIAIALGIVWTAVNAAILNGQYLETLDKFNSVLQTVLISLDLPFFASGMLTQLYFSTRSKSSLTLLIANIVVCCLVIMILSFGKPYAYEYAPRTVIVFLFVAALFYALVSVPQFGKWFSSKLGHSLLAPFVRIGVVSYAWYLIHQNIGVTLIYHLNGLLPGWLSIIIVLLATYLLGELLARTVEWRYRKPFELSIVSIARALLPPYRSRPA